MACPTALIAHQMVHQQVRRAAALVVTKGRKTLGWMSVKETEGRDSREENYYLLVFCGGGKT